MRKLLLTIVLIFITSCGFKIVNLSEFQNYNIVEINTVGESRINYIIKNHLLRVSKKDEGNKISVNITTSKERLIKEKNIKNEITKYEIKIVANVNIKKIYDGEDFEFTITKNGNYDVAKQNSTTRNNEKQLILLLSNDLADEILSETNIKLNDS
tara:strand:+ start:391 stop:855 length:465 start_codon:yes stop_codon:yes gene_type:complete